MAKSKKHTNSTPRRKRYNRNARLQNAKKWAEQYNGNNIAKGYSNWFGVDLLCAISELELLGYKLKESYKPQVKQSLVARQKHKESKKLEKEIAEGYFVDSFSYIKGFTSNGVPYGIMDVKVESEVVKNKKIETKYHQFNIDDDDLPF